MDAKLPAAEQCFVRLFVVPERRSRVLLELADPARRGACLLSFSEPHKGRLRMSRLHPLTEGASMATAMTALAEQGCDECEPVHIIHLSQEFDGRTLPLNRAVSEMWHRGPAVLVSEAKGCAMLLLDSGSAATLKAIMYI